MRVRALALLLLALAAPVGPAAAEVWQVRGADSRLGFHVVVNGIDVDGRFTDLSGWGEFDPAAPEESRLELVIDVGSLDVGNPLANAFARSADWFDTASHPKGRFRLDRVTRADGTDRWTAAGRLELRGVEQQVRVPLTLRLQDGAARATGEATFDRTRFGVGQGASAALVEVSRDVRVTFDLRAARADDAASPR